MDKVKISAVLLSFEQMVEFFAFLGYVTNFNIVFCMLLLMFTF